MAGFLSAVPMRRSLAGFLSVLLACLSCLPPALARQPALPTGWVEVGGQRFLVELALDDESRARGLMFRPAMPAGHGMLFVHDTTDHLAYWMKNTLLPLDILYFDEQRRLVSVQADVPPCRSAGNDCPVYPSAGPARFVLELNAGMAARLGLRPGAVLTLGPGIPLAGRGR